MFMEFWWRNYLDFGNVEDSMHSKEDNTEVDIKHVVMMTDGQLLYRVCLFVYYWINVFNLYILLLDWQGSQAGMFFFCIVPGANSAS